MVREHRIEIAERVGADGAVLTPLDEAGLGAAVETLKAAGVDAVAVCFLHSYRRADHEKSARAALERLMPDAYISLSSEVLPEFREYERLSTTVLNAYIGPRMQAYLDRFLARVGDLGITVEPYTIHSNGGLMSVRTVRETPVRTCLSGPAAGVVGATEVAKAAGFPNVVTFDVGRHQHRRLLDPRLAAAVHLDPFDRRLSDQDADDRHPRHRGGRRLHRLDG